MGFYLFFLLLNLIYILHIIVYYFYWKKSFANKNNQSEIKLKTAVSVVIVARNEEKNIAACIESVFAQNLTNIEFELIVVDDFSEDNTVKKIQEINYSPIQLIQLKDILGNSFASLSNKKRGIELAVSKAKNDLIICTDADTIVSKNWLQQIILTFENTSLQFCTGPILYVNNDSLLEQFQTADMYSMIGISVASLALGIPYMSNGANMAFRKNAFQSINAYENIDRLPTGDDVLLMHKLVDKYGAKSIQYINSMEAVVYTTSEKTFQGFFEQRTRWVSKSSMYSSNKIKLTLSFMYVYHLILLVAPFIFILMGWSLYPFIFSFIIKLMIDSIFINSVSKTYNKFFNVLFMPIFECFYICYISIIGISASIGNYTWKNRKIVRVN
jgi:cellulose synthase/poly-beta-1,6-N-acetylglucosamine synthase-like glycosyltransferase